MYPYYGLERNTKRKQYWVTRNHHAPFTLMQLSNLFVIEYVIVLDHFFSFFKDKGDGSDAEIGISEEDYLLQDELFKTRLASIKRVSFGPLVNLWHVSYTHAL